MIGQEQLNYAMRNLWNRKLRSALTLMSIFVGIATIFIFISFGLGLYLYVADFAAEAGTDKLIIQARGIGAPGADTSFALRDKELETIQKVNGISEAAGMSFNAAIIEKDGVVRFQYLMGFPTNSIEEQELVIEWFTVDVDNGRMLEKGDLDKVVLGYSYSQDNIIFDRGLKLGDKLTVNNRKLKVVGFFEKIGNPSDDSNIYVTEDEYLLLTNSTSATYAMIVARVSNVDEIDLVAERATKELRNVRGLDEGDEDFFVQTNQELIASFQSALNIVIGFVLLIAAISVIVSAINTSNTMFTSILERTKEIGVLKAIGATNKEILIVFLLESGILGFTAGFLGVLIGWALASIGGSILGALGWSFLTPRTPLLLFIALISFSTVIGIISGLIPAFNASKKNPVDSLRYE